MLAQSYQLKITHIYFLMFLYVGNPDELDWVRYLESHEAQIKVLTGLCS